MSSEEAATKNKHFQVPVQKDTIAESLAFSIYSIFGVYLLNVKTRLVLRHVC